MILMGCIALGGCDCLSVQACVPDMHEKCLAKPQTDAALSMLQVRTKHQKTMDIRGPAGMACFGQCSDAEDACRSQCDPADRECEKACYEKAGQCFGTCFKSSAASMLQSQEVNHGPAGMACFGQCSDAEDACKSQCDPADRECENKCYET